MFRGVAEVQSVVRVNEGKTYLVKTSGIKDRWIYLSVNPAKAGDYPAKASAASPEADIFCGRLVSAAEAQKLGAGKPVIRYRSRANKMMATRPRT